MVSVSAATFSKQLLSAWKHLFAAMVQMIDQFCQQNRISDCHFAIIAIVEV
jgi:hypothetical protein